MKLSLIIPTYNEKDNIKKLVIDILDEFNKSNIDGEIIIIDDNSPDETWKVVEELLSKHNNIRLVKRKGKLGLSSAVIEGFKSAQGDIFGVMDADLSHPVSKINEMYQCLVNGADIVVGSRYVDGGKIEGWNLRRKLLSKGATILARLFTEVMDPMSGFFMFKKDFFIEKEINSKGFKILLELLVKLNFKKIVEIPIIFTNRTMGKSKASIKEIFFYLDNLIKYLPYKKEIIEEFFKFAGVGLLGTFINVIILYIFTEYLNIYYIISAFIAFVVAVTVNFIFDKIWTFKEKLNNDFFKKFVRFFCVSLIALSINIFFLYIFTEFFKVYYIISQVVAIGISLIINFIGNKIWTFKRLSEN